MSQPAWRILESVTVDDILVEILEWSAFGGLTDPRALEQLAWLKMAALPVRQVRITLNHKGAVILEAGAMQFHAGRFDIDNSIPMDTRGLRRLFGAMVTGERLFRPVYRGSGTIWLEPSFQNFLLVGLRDESIVVDQGMFLCCDAGIQVASRMQGNVSAALFGGEGLFQTHLSGTGFVVLTSPVPMSEIVKISLTPGEKVVLDGSFALLRSGTVKFSVGKSSRTWFGTSMTGQGLVQTFEGKGEVWIAPMLPVYDRLSTLARPPLPGPPVPPDAGSSLR
ncbi:MAG: AIM24 family protein [Pseudomonadota bacterium]|nr:AIM24 family protein [Pseudomonadota bacterium]